jgi:hypothetical protein
MLSLGAAPAVAVAGGHGERPRITGHVAITGEPRVGVPLTAAGATWAGPAPLRPAYTWLRCADEGWWSCEWIEGAEAATYTPVEDDLGRRIRVWLTVWGPEGRADDVSSATAAVAPAPPPPSPPPVTPPPVTTPPVALPAPDTSAPGAGAVLPETAERAPLLSPFPQVRVRGRVTRAGALVTLLTVDAPSGVHIAIACHGRGCPARRWALATAIVRLRRFEHRLPAGTRLEIAVTRPGWIGKHTTLWIRRGRPPARRDSCLLPGATRPTPCPRR